MNRARFFASSAALTALVTAVSLPVASCVETSPSPEGFHVGSHVDDWRDEVIYQVLIDRFSDGDQSNDYRVNRAAPARYHGGDWKGLADRLDYIQSLGVTTLWISPIVRNVETDAGIDGYHGYWAQDPFMLNPHFGSLNDLRDLSSRAHARGMKIVLDIVTNHMGQLFYYDINMNGRPDEDVRGGVDPRTGKATSQTIHITEYDPDYQSPEVLSFTSLGVAGPAPVIFLHDPAINRVAPADPRLANPANYHRRGRIINYDAPPDGREQTLFGDFPGGLKDLNTESPQVVDAMVEAYGHWIEAADLDGFRIDTVKHVDHPFWQQFNARIRDRAASLGKTKFLMFGEVFDGDDALVGSYTKNKELDGLFDFPQYFQVFRDVFIGGAPTKQIEGRWAQRRANWSLDTKDGGLGIAPADLHVNFLDNHDVGRFLWQAGIAGGRPDAIAVLWNALAFQLMEDGIPCIYYGTEQNFDGGNDPANREDLWQSGYDTGNPTFQRIARLTRIRRGYKALTRGDLKFVFSSPSPASDPAGGIIAFERTTTDGGYALVVINTSTHPASTIAGAAAMKVSGAPATVLVDVLPTAGASSVTIPPDGTLKIDVPPLTAMIFLPQGVKI